jgi:hypothetical protein
VPGIRGSIFGLLAAVLLPTGGSAIGVQEGSVLREPCADRSELRRPFFGDLHVHTALSLDASTMNTRNRPADAYRFARGERLGVQPYTEDGRALRHLQLSRPLDFTAVTDHAELFGEVNICNTPGLPGHGSLVCRIYRGWPRLAFFWMNRQASLAQRHDFCGEGGVHCLEAAHGPWQETREAAEAAYDRSSRCEFTSFVAYEWTGGAGAGNNFHRNVIFANDVVPDLPISFVDSPRLPDFFARLDRECVQAGLGCDVVVIPHNSNLSAGRMFQTTREDGSPIDAEEARSLARHQRLVEVMQHKGDSECMPGLASEDELCGFEKLAMNNFSGRFIPWLAEPPLARQFVRNVLKEGLRQEERLGVNPFQLGLIASTDTHLGLAGFVAEDASYPGHGGAGKPPGDDLPRGLPDAIDFNPGGLAVLWAEENSRHSLFDAMRRREAYGTSGPRIIVRFFGGWDYPASLCEQPDLAQQGYATGVPMGDELPPRPGAEPATSPVFVVSALADAGTALEPGTPLQRVQIVKGWLADDASFERVFDVAGGENGARVDPSTCEQSGPGSAALCSVWRDPDFDPTQRAFYYARVIENPTCRWSQKLCLATGVRCDEPGAVPEGFEPCCAPEHQPVIQERAWTSPIWYRPAAP